jgi:hypothetical protein
VICHWAIISKTGFGDSLWKLLPLPNEKALSLRSKHICSFWFTSNHVCVLKKGLMLYSVTYDGDKFYVECKCILVSLCKQNKCETMRKMFHVQYSNRLNGNL